MHSLAHLNQSTALKVFLTATLAPCHEELLAKSAGALYQNMLVLRSPVTRLNHQFQIAPVSHSNIPFGECAQLASLLLEQWSDDSDARGIIFIRSLEKLKALRRFCPFDVSTFSGKMTEEEKDTQLSSWFSGHHPSKWIISTTALLHGIDYQRVDAVIFLEMPFGLYDFVQGAGRGGRSGQQALIVVLHNGVPKPFPEESPYGCRDAMENVLRRQVCRRSTISEVMDGKASSCSDLPGSILCDFCANSLHTIVTKAINRPLAALPPSKDPTDAPPSSSSQQSGPMHKKAPQPPPETSPARLLHGFAAQAAAKSRMEHAESIKDLMSRFAGCFACRIFSDHHDPCHPVCGASGASGCTVKKHIPFQCTKATYKNGWIDWKKYQFSWPKDISRCYFCGLPRSVAGPGHQSPDLFPGICQFSDTAVVAAWHILHTPHLLERLQAEMGFTPGPQLQKSFADWLTSYGPESEDIRLLSTFSWLCRLYYPEFASNCVSPTVTFS